MAYDQFPVQRGRFAIENVEGAETNFGFDLTSDVASNFFDIRHESFFIKRDRVIDLDPTVVQRAFQRRNSILGPSHASAKVTAFWTGTNQVLDSATSATKRAQSKILEAVFGGYTANQGSAVVASPAPTTSTATVTAGQGTRFSIGQVVAIGTTAATALPVQLTNVSTDALTWWPALASAPATADKVYNSQTIFCDEDISQAIQCLHEYAVQRGNIWLGLGGSVSGFSLDLSSKSLAKWSLDLAFAQYKHDDEITTPQGGSAITTASYDDTTGVYVAEGGCVFTPQAGVVRTTVKVASLSISFGGAAKRFEIGYYNGIEGRGAPERDTREPITAELTLLKSDPYEDYRDAIDAETLYSLAFWMGAGAGTGRSLFLPVVQITSEEEVDVFGGLRGLKLSLLAHENSRSPNATATLRRSPFVLGHY